MGLNLRRKAMSYHIEVVGCDKAKVKDAIRASQAKEENPHNGTPPWVVERLCSEVDRVRIYEFSGKRYALRVKAAGSFHEQGSNDALEITQLQLVE